MTRDKKKHIAAGWLAGFTGGWFGLVLGFGIIPFAILFPLLAGTIKELFDIKTIGFDWKDIKFTMIGGGIAVIFWLIFILSGINDYAGLM